MPLGTTFDYCSYYLTYFTAQYSSKKDERMIGDYPDLPPISAAKKMLPMSLLRPFTLEPNCACVLIYAPKF